MTDGVGYCTVQYRMLFLKARHMEGRHPLSTAVQRGHEMVFKPFEPGDRTVGYIKSIREDRKINLTLELHERSAQDVLADRIMEHLKASGGASALTDYSPPQAIYKQFGVSKGKYKKALGKLYKQRRISLSRDKVMLLGPAREEIQRR